MREKRKGRRRGEGRVGRREGRKKGGGSMFKVKLSVDLKLCQTTVSLCSPL